GGGGKMMVEAVFWFYPLVWRLGARMMEEREGACDEEVLRAGVAPTAYARGILRVCEHCLQPPIPGASAIGGADLKRRIERIVDHRVGRTPGRAVRCLLAAAGIVAILLPLAAGSARAPRFEQPSIRNYIGTAEGAIGPVREDGISLRNVTLGNCIGWAWGLEPEGVTGPAWIHNERYLVAATAAGAADESQLRRMLQGLLAE